jgi:hypothetical protein
MSVHKHILLAGGKLETYTPELSSAFAEVVKRVVGQLPLPDVDIVIADNPNASIPETGVGGYAPTANLIYVNIDALRTNLREHLHAEIVSTIAHELHHCARTYAIGYGKTLLEALISEGLADHFDIEVNQHLPKPWSLAVEGEVLNEMLTRASAEFESETYDHAAWFFGSEEKDVPRWLGYSLGFHLVREYMKKTSRTAAELVATEAKLFVA